VLHRLRYVQRMSRVRYVTRDAWFELLIAVLANNWVRKKALEAR